MDLVITDLVMPAISGRELAERIQQLRPGVKILCMSGYVMSPDRLAAAAYLQKPFTSRQLLAKTRQMVGSTPAID